MKLYLSNSINKLLSKQDIIPLGKEQCLKNESYYFQIYIENSEAGEIPFQIQSNLDIIPYEVVWKKGNYELNKKTDDWYIKTPDDTYPDLLVKLGDSVSLAGKDKTLFFEIPATEKQAGIYDIEITIGQEKVVFQLEVINENLAKNDLLITHWIYADCVCNYYGVEPFTKEFYSIYDRFLKSYVKLGNNMVFVPVFTPPLDTDVGLERLTTQLVKAKKVGSRYEFNFDKVKEYIDFIKGYGIQYFEFSHLFTQWGGKCAPKIIIEENGEERKAFGWDTPSDDEEYLNFLKEYLQALNAFVEKEGIKENCYMHLTDEPRKEHIEKYEKLSAFVKQYNGGIKIIDAISNYDIVEKELVSVPAVYMDVEDYSKFNDREKFLYYCVWADTKHLTNRYFHMPALRTQILGVQLYHEKAKGFLHWGYNFYNAQLSKKTINPYEDCTAGGGFVAGDSFLVYPGKDDVEYSLRYFEIVKAFEDYRLLKALEGKIGREKVDELLQEMNYTDLHEYSREENNYLMLKKEIYSLLVC